MPKTNFYNGEGLDLGDILVPKEYLIDRYPELSNATKMSTLWTWGYNILGALGDNTGGNSTSDKSSPVQTIAGGANWKNTSISGGYFNSAAIKTDGTLWTWGGNAYGQLGDNTTAVRKLSPVIVGANTWRSVRCGYYHVIGIRTDNTLWTWGANTGGQLGDNTRAIRSSPVQTIAGGSNWKIQGCGQGISCAVKTDGTLWTWGFNSDGQLGDGTTASKSSPVQTISGGTNWVTCSMTRLSTIAIKSDGTLWTWGANNFGQLGDDSIVAKSSPVQTIAAGTNWKLVSAGSYHVAAIKTDGSLWTWGFNANGELGDGTIIFKSSPVQTVAGGTNWKLASGGRYHNAAIKTDGTLWTWGVNNYGQLGDGSIIAKSSPAQTITAGTNWKQVACGYNHTIAVRDDSTDEFGESL